MKKTALYDTHLQLGAKIAPFGGYEMPIQYSNISKEHMAVRQQLGVFDVSHMGEFYVKGPAALSLLQKICSNDISKIEVGKAQYNYFPNGRGGIVDDLIVYRLESENYMLVVNASNIEKDWDWVVSQNQDFRAVLENRSEDIALLAIQGPQALAVMQALTPTDLSSLPFYAHTTASFAGVEDVLIATTGYTGAGGIEIYFPNDQAIHIWNAVLEAGASQGIVPVGLAARDTLRLEMGYCLYGNEIDDTTSPIAAGLGWVTRPEAGCIDAENLKLQKQQGVTQKLMGIQLKERGIPRTGYEIFNTKEEKIGRITSGTQSPVLNKGIGLGYLDKAYANPQEQVFLKIRDKFCEAEVIKPPFI